MGNSSSAPIFKRGKLYADMRNNLSSLDLILFSGPDFVSSLIKYMEKKELGKLTYNFSHVGLVIKPDLLDYPEYVKDGGIFVFESTAGGLLGPPPDVEGNTFIGVQLRDMDVLIPLYDQPNNTSIAVAKLVNPPKITPELRAKFTTFFREYNGTPYDPNPLNLCSSLFPCCRKCRDATDEVIDDDWLFCSEFIAMIYKAMGILPETLNVANVVPDDFVTLPGTNANGRVNYIPPIFHDPVYVTTPIHYDVNVSRRSPFKPERYSQSLTLRQNP